MKKLFAVLAIAGFMTACKDKKDEKKVEDTMTTTPTTTTTTTDNPTTPTTTDNMSSGTITAPKFSDPEVQQFANDYAAFWNEYKAGKNDPAKLADLSKKMSDWSTKAQSVGMKLAKTPNEAKVWSDWVVSINKEMMPQQ